MAKKDLRQGLVYTVAVCHTLRIKGDVNLV
jgi:hypothetical protein